MPQDANTISRTLRQICSALHWGDLHTKVFLVDLLAKLNLIVSNLLLEHINLAHIRVHVHFCANMAYIVCVKILTSMCAIVLLSSVCAGANIDAEQLERV